MIVQNIKQKLHSWYLFFSSTTFLSLYEYYKNIVMEMPKLPLLNAIFQPKAIQERALPTELCTYRPTTLPPTWTLDYKWNGELLFYSEKNLDISEGKVSPGHLSISKKIGYFFFLFKLCTCCPEFSRHSEHSVYSYS